VSAGVAATPTDARVRTLSPVLLAMVAISAWGAWQLWQMDGQIALTLGPAGIAAVLAWVAYGAIAVGIVVALQRFARRPAWGVALALAWGGFAATWAAGEANGALSTIFVRTAGTDPHAWLSTPVVEESMKALGVLGLALIPVLRRVRALDGLFYGVLVGAGFQVVEDAIYTVNNLISTSGDPSITILGTIIMRGLTVGLFTHAVYAGIAGAAIGWAASAPAGRRAGWAASAVAVLLAMMVVHGIFNTQDTLTPVMLAASLVPFAVLLVVLWWARGEEVRHLADEAAANDGWGVLGVEERATITAPRPSTRGGRRARDRVLRFAWAADHLGPESRRAARAAGDVTGSRTAA